MVTTIETTVVMPKTLFDRAEIVAQELDISCSHLFELAVANFIQTYQSQTQAQAQNQALPDPNELANPSSLHVQAATQLGDGRIAIKQGDIYWLLVAEPGYPHPHVVIQDDAINDSRINTVVVCALTSNQKRATEPGNVILEVGEANLARQSVIVVSQIDTVAKTQLGAYIGSLNKQRIAQIFVGMRFQQAAFFARYQAR